MCSPAKFEEMDGEIDSLSNRLATAESRLTKLETTVADMRNECRQGFSDVKDQLRAIYEERTEWGKWARAHLGLAFKWVGIIVLGACGINQASNIIQTLARCFGMNL